MKLRASLAIAVVSLAVAAWAADPWEIKSPDQWTKKEVDRILRNSPWTKIISVPTTWARTGGEEFGVGVPSTITLGQGGPTIGSNRSDDEWDPQNHKGYFLLRWASSRTIQAAVERRAALRAAKSSAASPANAPKPLAREDPYELELVWDLFARFPQATDEEAAKNSYLRPRRKGVEFKPVRVEYRRGPADAVHSVAFYFPRKTQDGEPLIVPDETEVEFGWRVGPSLIRAKFNPSKMVARGAQDF